MRLCLSCLLHVLRGMGSLCGTISLVCGLKRWWFGCYDSCNQLGNIAYSWPLKSCLQCCISALCRAGLNDLVSTPSLKWTTKFLKEDNVLATWRCTGYRIWYFCVEGTWCYVSGVVWRSFDNEAAAEEKNVLTKEVMYDQNLEYIIDYLRFSSLHVWSKSLSSLCAFAFCDSHNNNEKLLLTAADLTSTTTKHF